MSHQKTLAKATFEENKKSKKREKYLAEMERIVPWKGLYAIIKPYYSKPSKGLPQVSLERMQRTHLLQSWFYSAGTAAEGYLYDMKSMSRLVGIDLENEPIPDKTTISKFCHLLGTEGLRERIFQEVNAHIEEKGLTLSEETIMDVTNINAPSSTKNQDKKRDTRHLLHETGAPDT